MKNADDNFKTVKTQTVPLLSNKIIGLILIVIFLCFASLAHAQADRGGLGGDWTEGDFKHFLSRLGPYLQSTEGKKTFPEVGEYDQNHPDETTAKVISELNPRLVDHPLKDENGNERTCISHLAPTRYFECNLKALPAKPAESAEDRQKSEYYGSLYRLTLHEVFVQIALEAPVSKEIPSGYALSSRLMVHLENFPEWVPGAAHDEDALQYQIAIRRSAEWRVSFLGGESALNDSPYPSVHLGVGLSYQIPVTIGAKDFKFGANFSFLHTLASSDAGAEDGLTTLIFTIEREYGVMIGVRPFVSVGIGFTVNTTRSPQLYSSEGSTFSQSVDRENAYFVWNVSPGFYFGRADRFAISVDVIKLVPGGYYIIPSFSVKF